MAHLHHGIHVLVLDFFRTSFGQTDRRVCWHGRKLRKLLFPRHHDYCKDFANLGSRSITAVQCIDPFRQDFYPIVAYLDFFHASYRFAVHL